MQIYKLLERRNRSKFFKEEADLTLEIASVYTDRGDHDLALGEYLKYLELWKTRDDKLQIALANRFIADCYIELGQHDKAITYTQAYLKLSIELSNRIEQQRAYVTLGRAFLNKSETEKDGPAILTSLKSAARAFLNSIKLIDQMSTTDCGIGSKQLAETRAVSLLNLGQVLRMQRDDVAACERFIQCTTLAEKHQLQKLLLRACYQIGETTLSVVPKHSFAPCKASDIIRFLQGAETMNKLQFIKSNLLSQVVRTPVDSEAKDLLKATREVFGQVLLNVGEFRKAAKVYRLLKINYPSSSDLYTSMIHKSIQLSNLMNELHHVSAEFPTTPNDLTGAARVHERLGDIFGGLELNGAALRHYQFMLSYARLAYDQTASGTANTGTDHQLANFVDAALVSVAETYRALGENADCVLTYQEEIEWVTSRCLGAIPVDLANSWFSMARAQRQCRPDDSQPGVSPIPTLQSALEAVERTAAAPSQLRIEILTELLDYLRCNDGDQKLMLDTEKRLKIAKQAQPNEISSQLTGEEDEGDRDLETEEEDGVGDIELTGSIVDDLSSDSEVERCVGGNTQVLDEHRDRERSKNSGKALCLKTNMKGETPLHIACINGDMDHVVKLIEVLGHPVNVSDGAGWLPLHEAAFHDRTDVAVYLLDRGARLDDTGCPMDMSTPLFEAIHGGGLATALLLVQRGANLWHRNKQGECLPNLLDAWQPTRRSKGSFSSQRTLFDQLLAAIRDRLRGDYDRWCALKRSTPPTESSSSSESPPSRSHKIPTKKKKQKEVPLDENASTSRASHSNSWRDSEARQSRTPVAKSLRGRNWNELLVDLDEDRQGEPSKSFSNSPQKAAVRAYQEAMQCLAGSSSKRSQKRKCTSKGRQDGVEVLQSKRKKMAAGVIDAEDDGWLVLDEPKFGRTSHQGPPASIRGHVDSLRTVKQPSSESTDGALPGRDDDPLSTVSIVLTQAIPTVKHSPLFTSTQNSRGTNQPTDHGRRQSSPVESIYRGFPSQPGSENLSSSPATLPKPAMPTSQLPSSVKVAFPDVSVLVPIGDGSRSIAWLAEEAYRRRRVLTSPSIGLASGTRVAPMSPAGEGISVRLSTRDGALLLPTDRLRSVLPSLQLSNAGSTGTVELLAEISPTSGESLASSPASSAARGPTPGVVVPRSSRNAGERSASPVFASSCCLASLLDRLGTAAGGGGAAAKGRVIDLSHWSLGNRDCVSLLAHLFSKIDPASVGELRLSGNALTDAFLLPTSSIPGSAVTGILAMSPPPGRHLEHLTSLSLEMNLIGMHGFVAFLESLHSKIQAEQGCVSKLNHVLPNLKYLSVGHNPLWNGGDQPAAIRLASGWTGHVTHWTTLIDYLTLRLPRLTRLQLAGCGLDADAEAVIPSQTRPGHAEGFPWTLVDRPVDCGWLTTPVHVTIAPSPGRRSTPMSGAPLNAVPRTSSIVNLKRNGEIGQP